MAATNEEVLTRWLEECGRENPRWLQGPELRVDRDTGALTYGQRQRPGRFGMAIPRTRMAVFAGDRYKNGIIVLNGDGLEGNLTDWQNEIRDRSRREFTNGRTAIIPFAALTGANIRVDTIKVIEVTEDTANSWDMFLKGWDARMPLILAKYLKDGFPEGWSDGIPNRENDSIWTGSMPSGERVRLEFRRGSRSEEWRLVDAHVWAQPEHGRYAWQGLSFATDRPTLTKPNRGGSHYRTGWYWIERVHRLGAVVFSAVCSTDERRHRYLSAFDMQELGGLYFLAMLPDRGECKTYDQALYLLAPEMVHKARAEGRLVYRQGDVFAIETKLTSSQIYKGAITRVRRAVVMQNDRDLLSRNRALLQPTKDEVSSKGTCIYCACHPIVGNGIPAQRALSIHRTGHTASEVVVKEAGITYIRGNMFHDPHIENPERFDPDHQPIQLGETAEIFTANMPPDVPPIPGNLSELKWYLAIRNTVPSLRPRRIAPATTPGTVDASEAATVSELTSTSELVALRAAIERDHQEAILS